MGKLGIGPALSHGLQPLAQLVKKGVGVGVVGLGLLGANPDVMSTGVDMILGKRKSKKKNSEEEILETPNSSSNPSKKKPSEPSDPELRKRLEGVDQEAADLQKQDRSEREPVTPHRHSLAERGKSDEEKSDQDVELAADEVQDVDQSKGLEQDEDQDKDERPSSPSTF